MEIEELVEVSNKFISNAYNALEIAKKWLIAIQKWIQKRIGETKKFIDDPTKLIQYLKIFMQKLDKLNGIISDKEFKKNLELLVNYIGVFIKEINKRSFQTVDELSKSLDTSIQKSAEKTILQYIDKKKNEIENLQKTLSTIKFG